MHVKIMFVARTTGPPFMIDLLVSDDGPTTSRAVGAP